MEERIRALNSFIHSFIHSFIWWSTLECNQKSLYTSPPFGLMRALKTLLKMTVLAFVLVLVLVGMVAPAVWLYTVKTLPNPIESAQDIEMHLRHSIESERHGIQTMRASGSGAALKWPTPEFAALPQPLTALYVTTTGCPDFFRSPKEQGWPWVRRLVAQLLFQRILDGDGACELIFARHVARRLDMKTELHMVVAADRIHRFLAKDELVAFDLHSLWFEPGVIGVEPASSLLMQKPLAALTLAELVELQLAIPPWGYWEDIKECKNAGLLKEARNTLLAQLAQGGHVGADVAKTASAQPVRCLTVNR